MTDLMLSLCIQTAPSWMLIGSSEPWHAVFCYLKRGVCESSRQKKKTQKITGPKINPEEINRAESIQLMRRVQDREHTSIRITILMVVTV